MNGGSSALRGALMIVLAGAALGMVYNGMALRSHPPHGIPWIAAKEELPSLEAMNPQDSISMALGSGAPSAETPSPTSPSTDPTPSHGTVPAPGATQPRGEHPAPTAGGTTKAPPAGGATQPPTGSSEPAPSPSAPDPRPTAPLPFIPESDKPIQVQLPTVTRFFAAHAALFVDARDATEFEAGHIPGAIRLTGPEANTEPERMKALPVQGRPIICYCEGGACEASLDLAKVLIEAGHKKVLVYMGGYPEWAQAGQPVEKGAAK